MSDRSFLPLKCEAPDHVGMQVIKRSGELASSTRKDESESRLDYPIREALEKFSPVKTQVMTGLSSRGSPKSATSMQVPQNGDLEFVL